MNIRRKRLIKREYDMFGERMLEGGDMHIQFKRFLKWAMNYEENINEDIGQEKTEQWLSRCNIRLIRVNGAMPIEKITKKIVSELDYFRGER